MKPLVGTVGNTVDITTYCPVLYQAILSEIIGRTLSEIYKIRYCIMLCSISHSSFVVTSGAYVALVLEPCSEPDK